MKSQDIGPGSMIYTVIYRKLNGSLDSELVLGSHSKATAWQQSQKKFNKRALALIPGNHNVILGS